jgi:hypothetical protein
LRPAEEPFAAGSSRRRKRNVLLLGVFYAEALFNWVLGLKCKAVIGQSLERVFESFVWLANGKGGGGGQFRRNFTRQVRKLHSITLHPQCINNEAL